MTIRTFLIGSAATLSLIACTQQPTKPEVPTPTAKRAAMEWVAVQTGTGTSSEPITTLRLVVSGSDQELYHTTCTGIPSDQPIDDAAAAVRCWWAGGGDEYAVFIGDAEKMTIKHRTVDEEAGFGTWEEVK